MQYMKVTQKLRETWAMQREQMLEEYEHTQDGTPRSAGGKREIDIQMAVYDRLFALPLGAKFNGQEIQKEVAAEWTS